MQRHQAIVAVGDPLITDHINASVPESPTLERRISIGPEIPDGWEDFHAGLQNAGPFQRPDFQTENSDPLIVSFTSGTTGNPKMVLLDTTYPLGHIQTALFWHNLHENSLHLTISDTGWLKAMWGKLYGQWLAGATVFVYDHEKFHAADILKMIEKHKVTSLCAPPTIFRFMIREDLSQYDLSSLEWATIAGEALNPSVYDQFYKLTGIKLREGYGQSETTVVVLNSLWIEPKLVPWGCLVHNMTLTCSHRWTTGRSG
jgi:acetyl-CoA synthetase